MALQNETVLRTGRASTTDDVALLISEAFTEIGGGAVLVVSEDTLWTFVKNYDGLQNPPRTFERMKLEKLFFGRPMATDSRVVGSVFIVTDTHNCILVRYEPA